MVESSSEGRTAKPVRRNELAEAPDLLRANSRLPPLRISKERSAPG
jgi:hypothetical protein